ncbi:lysylphosphatidylglycerol synthase domain-containing protein [Candidatus Viridilinea mediisalina]|uniref:Lysylphosphatidylglycerol synthetase n=1 Tax=Candidatus Viridilinea mediisalina TaxID=2024553 RepID=A0A2A6RM00_9CHLR|nr:lysylphosphatidylglycerol synthase domain-containing protein [Candidatus Viridilinea mediisalina]PDW03889.1 hypothetical protein CJ255_06455 [Candidatus Viridilinea mediisalina]
MQKQLVEPLPLQLRLRKWFTAFQQSRWQWVVIGLCFVLFNGYILYRLYQDWGQLRALEWPRPDLLLLGLTALVQFSGALLLVYSWTYMMGQFGYQVSFRRHFRVYMISNLARKIPGFGWNIISRVYMYQRDTGDVVKVTATSLAETVIFGIAAAVVALLALLLPGSQADFIPPSILIGVILGFVALVPSPIFRPVLRWLNKGQPPEHQLRWPHLLQWAGLNVLVTVLGGITLYLFCRAFGMIEPGDYALIIQCWALTVVVGALLFWMPASSGVSNSITVVILATIMPMPQALLLMLLWRVWVNLTEVTWGGISLLL